VAAETLLRGFWQVKLGKLVVRDAPSLYTAFGNKETLFLESVARYVAPAWPTAEGLQRAPSARQAVKDLLEGSARLFTQPHTPSGCLMATAAATGSELSQPVRAALTERRQDLQALLQARIQQDIQAGTLPTSTPARPLAALTIALMQGLSTLARDGAGREDLFAVVQSAMDAWPPPDRVEP